MTENEREEAFKYIESQLEYGYLDLGLHDQNELEIVKEAIKMLKLVDKWNDIPLMTTEWMKFGCTEEEAKELAEASKIWL